MQVLLVIIATLALCYAVDKGFYKIFRRKPQHQSGKSVRLTKKYMLSGILILVFAAILLAASFTAENNASKMRIIAGALALMGGGLVVYFITFGVYYDNATFLFSAFGKKSQAYRYGQILEQQLLVTKGGICVELFLDDGRDVDLYANMDGVYEFLDTAFAGWCKEKGLTIADCPWHDPANSCWFPPHDPEAAKAAENITSYEVSAEEQPKGSAYQVEPMDKE